MKTSLAPQAEGEPPGIVTLRSADGAVAVTVRWTPGGVFVKRSLTRHGAARVMQAATFHTLLEFRRWCDADAIRFDDPLMSARLVRHGDELFSTFCVDPAAR